MAKANHNYAELGKPTWFEITSDSMEPEFKAGDTVLVDPTQAPESGDIVVTSNGLIRRLFRDRESILLLPFNLEKQRAVLLDQEPVFLGRVVEHRPAARAL